MTYTPFHADWKDYPDVTTPITAAAMEYIEAGIASMSPVGTVIVASASELQAAIDAITSGSNEEIDILVSQSFTATETITCGSKRFRLIGYGRPNYTNDLSGVVIATGSSSMTLFSIDAGASLNQTGPTFENLGFSDVATGSTLFAVNNTNRVTWRDCFLSGATRTDGGTGISCTFTSTNDCSWHLIENCHISRLATGISYAKGYGAVIVGGTCVGCTIGIDIAAPVSHMRVYGMKGDGGFPFIKCLGSFNHFTDIVWETTSSSSASWQGVLFDGDGVTANSGKYNTIHGGDFVGSGGANTRGLQITAASAGCYASGVVAAGCGTGIGIVNESTTSRVDRSNPITSASGFIDFGGVRMVQGTSSPEGVVSASVGSVYLRTDGSGSTTFYTKISGTGNTGWERAITAPAAAPTVSGAKGGLSITERYAQGLSAQTSTSVFSPASTIQAGNLAVLCVGHGLAKTISSVTDTAGNTWAVDASANDGTRYLQVASCQVATNITTGDSITITWSVATSSGPQIWVQEVDGAATSSAFDKSASGTGSGTSASTSATATLSQANEIVFALEKVTTANSFTLATGYTNATTAQLDQLAHLSYKIVSATTAVTGGATTLSVSQSWTALVATYKGVEATNFNTSLISALSSVGIITDGTT